jgi:hypothetical protein
MGGGGSLSIAEHISGLTERQADFHKTRNSLAAKKRINRRAYKATRPGQFGTNDVAGRNTLSGYAFTLYWTEAKFPLICEEGTDGSCEFWSPRTPRENRRDCTSYMFWDSGHERCPCERRIAYNMQCRHELARDKRFIKESWSPRWYNDDIFRKEFSDLTFSHSVLGRRLVDDANDGGDLSLHSDDEDGVRGDDDGGGKPSVAPGTMITYHSLMERCGELARLVQREQPILDLVDQGIETLIQRIRNGQGVEMTFMERTVLTTPLLDTGPARGRLGSVPNPQNSKRMRSRHEISANHRHQYKRPHISNDEEFADRNVKTKSCGFCRQTGHKINHCPRITVYKSPPLKTKDQRNNFMTELERPNHFAVEVTIIPEKRPIARSFPKYTKGLVIHAKRQVGVGVGELFYECTLLMAAGKPHHEYTNYPFTKAPIISFIARSNTSIVIIKLRLTDDGYQTFGIFGGQSQSSALNLSQGTEINSINGFSQLQFSQNQMDGMGWGSRAGEI